MSYTYTQTRSPGIEEEKPRQQLLVVPENHVQVFSGKLGTERQESLFRNGAPESAIIIGDARNVLANLPSDIFQTCVTSPPYWSLRDYGIAGQIGLEPSLEGYIASLVETFEQVRRTLKDDGALWLNIGDSYTSGDRT